MIWRRFEDIDKADIEALLTNGISESKTIDYKETLSLSNRDEKKEFVADICAFANTAGGDIVFGVEEERDCAGRPTGIPLQAHGLPDMNFDQEVLRISNLLRDSVQPRLQTANIRKVEDFAKGPVLVVRVGQSWNAPHMNTLDSKFYARTNAGKYPMDVNEIRSAFLLSGNIASRLQDFRDERIRMMDAGITPIGPLSGPVAVLHVVPRSALDTSRLIDISAFVQNSDNRMLIAPIGSGWRESHYNFDGFAMCNDNEYSQLFRTGAWETVDQRIAWDVNGVNTIGGGALANALVGALTKLLRAYKQFEIMPPVFIMVTLLNTHGCDIAVGKRFHVNRSHRIDRGTLYLPDVLIEDFQIHPSVALRPVFDTLWQTGGLAQCTLYGPDGTWAGE